MLKLSVLSLFFLFPLPAAFVRLEITERRDVPAGPRFIAYELLRGRAHFAVNPSLPANRRITDLALASRNPQGRVEFSADVVILRPQDAALGNGTLLVEPPNRGGMGMLSMYNRASQADEFGDGYLLREGYTLAWVGWQHDVPSPRLRADVPVAVGVTGRVRGEHTPSAAETRLPLADSGHVPYPVAGNLTLSVREGLYAPRRPETGFRLEGDTIVLAQPATPGHIYEFVYDAKDPPVAGLGLAALRDFVSELKHGRTLPRPLRYALGVGTSQSAMALKALVYEGFNADEQGRIVFDGLQPHVAGGRRATFERFTQPSRTSGPYRNASFSPTDQFPYSDAEDTELATGRRDSLLARARTAKVVPKILYTNSSYEYWGSAGALVHTSLDGQRDLALPSTTRLYLLAGGQHGPAPFPPRLGGGQNLPNWNDYRWALRALLRDLRDWVVDGKAPPESCYPRLADGTLHAGTPPAYRVQYLDFGPDYLSKGIVTHQPPRPGVSYTVLTPKPDADGNDLVGLKMPWVAVPLGAFTGWNLRSPLIGAAGGLLPQTGSYLPFPTARIQERYPSRATYLRQISDAAQRLVQDRFLLPEDIAAVEKMGARVWDWAVH
ncbi:MAG: hypothetical protein K2X03_16455 [Bryobacteraceae bacterium]|nr:hypothetical protein [Bryobacteraceae bacterium]